MDSLPDEVLEDILDYLPSSALETMLRVSIKYYDLITGCSKLIHKIMVIVTPYSCDSLIESKLLRSIWVRGEMTKWHFAEFINARNVIMSCTTKMVRKTNKYFINDI